MKYHQSLNFARLYRPKFNSALLKQAGGSKLMMPIDTQWNTLAYSIESYLKNSTILFNI